MADALAEKIQQLETEIEEARPGLEEACGKFIDAVALGLEDFWPGFVDRCIQHARDEIAAMSDDQVGALKADVEAVVARPREVAQRELVEENEAVWPHLAPLEDIVARQESRPDPRYPYSWIGTVRGPRRHAPTEFGDVMEFAAGAPSQPLGDANLPLLQTSWKRKASTTFDWTDVMVDALKEYAVTAREMLEKCDSLSRARTERDKREALDRWNQV